MLRWVVGSIHYGVDPLNYFSFQAALHDRCNKGRGMYYPVCGMMHIKEPLLLIGKSSLCGVSGFPLSLSEWSLPLCLVFFYLSRVCVCVYIYIYIYSGILHNNNYISSFNFHSFYYSFFNIIMEMCDIKHLSFKRVV